MWINATGSNFTSQQVVDLINNSTGTGYTVADLEATYKVGRTYRNGSLYFQRLS